MLKNTILKNEFYNAEIINNTSNDIECKYNAILSAPLLDVPQDYNVAVNRFHVPITSIPLTKKNIPFKSWQVSLSYNDTNSWNSDSQYVPQWNEKTDNTNTLMFVNTSTNSNPTYKFVRDSMIISNTSCEQVQSFDFTYPSNSYPLSSSNTNFIAVSFIGTHDIFIFDHHANLISTITNNESRIVIRLYMDSNSNLFILYQTADGLLCVKYNYNSNKTWTSGLNFTSFNTIINDPQDICFDYSTNKLYVTSQNRLYWWDSLGFESTVLTGSVAYSNDTTLQASKMTLALGSLMLSFEPKPFYEDQLYYVKSNLVYSIDNVQQTVGSVISSPVIINSSSKYMFAILANNKLSVQQFPLNPTVMTWYPVEQITNLSMIFCDTTNTNLYAIDTANNLLAFNLSNGSNYWTQISSNFKISQYETITTLDSCVSNKLICSGSNNTLYKSSYPLTQRPFIIGNKNGSGLQLIGINNNNNGSLQKVVLNNNIPLNNPICNYKSICFDGTSYYVGNIMGSVDKYNKNFVYQTSYMFQETAGNIGMMHYGTKSGYIYATSLQSNNRVASNVKIFNTSGIYQGTIWGGYGCLNVIYEIPYASFPIAVTFTNNGSNSFATLFNISNATSPLSLLTFQGASNVQVLDVVYNATNNSLYLLEGSYVSDPITGALNYLNGVQVEQIVLNGTFTAVVSRTMIIQNKVGITSLNINSNSQELYLTYASTELMQIYSIINGSVYGTVSLPTGITSENLCVNLPLLNTTSYMSFSNVGGGGCNIISASRSNEDLFYATRLNINWMFYGYMFLNNISWIEMNNTLAPYVSISCCGNFKQSSSNVQMTSYSSYNNSFS